MVVVVNTTTPTIANTKIAHGAIAEQEIAARKIRQVTQAICWSVDYLWRAESLRVRHRTPAWPQTTMSIRPNIPIAIEWETTANARPDCILDGGGN